MTPKPVNHKGVYKPRVKCYDVSQMSMKFERCMDSEVVQILTLEEGYSKVYYHHLFHSVLPFITCNILSPFV